MKTKKAQKEANTRPCIHCGEPLGTFPKAYLSGDLNGFVHCNFQGADKVFSCLTEARAAQSERMREEKNHVPCEHCTKETE